MRIVNYTNIPTRVVREIIRFVRPDKRLGRFSMLIDEGKAPWAGVAQFTKSNIFPSLPIEKPTIVIKIPPQGSQIRRSDGRPVDRVEMLVFLLAHELRHFWQGNHPRLVDLEDEKALERDADTYAYERLEDWRCSRNLEVRRVAGE